MGSGDRFGLELLEGEEGTVAGAAGGIDAVLEFGEAGVVVRAGLAERVFLRLVVDVVLLVVPHLGFGGVEAAEEPLAADEVVEEGTGLGGGGEVVVVVLGDEFVEVGCLFAGGEEGFGVDAGFEGIHGGDGFACDRGRAGGFLGISTIRFDLA